MYEITTEITNCQIHRERAQGNNKAKVRMKQTKNIEQKNSEIDDSKTRQEYSAAEFERYHFQSTFHSKQLEW